VSAHQLLQRGALALAAMALTLAGFELALRLAELAPPPPLFVESGDGRLHVNPARPEVVDVAVDAQADRLRVLWLGDSTVVGMPYDPQLSPPRWLQWILAARGVHAEVVGLAGEGLDAGQVASLLRDALALRPDVVVLTTGHNEYLYAGPALRPHWWHSLRLWRQLQRATAPGPQAPGPFELPDHAAVAARFAASLDAMVAECAAAGVPLVLSEPVCNLADMPPVLGGPPGAADADTAFDAGRAALAAGDVAAAQAALRRARDLDRWPHRATSPLVAAVRERAPHLAHVEALFAASSATGVPGHDLFIDHCHPDPGGQRLLALAVADVLEDLRLAPATGLRGQAPPLAAGLVALGASDALLARARARTGRVFAGLALLRDAPGPLADEAARLLDDRALDPLVEAGELASSRALLALAQRDAPAARVQLEATAEHPAALARLRGIHDRYAWVAAAFRRAGLPPP